MPKDFSARDYSFCSFSLSVVDSCGNRLYCGGSLSQANMQTWPKACGRRGSPDVCLPASTPLDLLSALLSLPWSDCLPVLPVWPTLSKISDNHYQSPPTPPHLSITGPHLPESSSEYLSSNFTSHYFFMSSEEARFLALLHPTDLQGRGGQPPGDQTGAVC